jgi:antistasin family protein
MRLASLPLLLALAACTGALDRANASEDGAGSGSGSGQGGAPFGQCIDANDCVPAGPKCCDCPTHAVPVDDPAQMACQYVECPPPSCGSPMEAACNNGKCVLACSPVECIAASCPDGFATDGNGCLTCACAAPATRECTADGDCARVRADCCGCMMGGNDTSVPASEVGAHEAALNCPTNPSCPTVNTCAPELSARCVAGECTLVSGALPGNACGRPDLPACPAGEVCTVNASDPATMQGLGVCRLPP